MTLQLAISTAVSAGNKRQEYDIVESVSAGEFATRFESGNVEVIDVRKPDEFLPATSGSAKPAFGLHQRPYAEFPKRQRKLHIHYAGGYRSMVAASILKSAGIDDVVSIEGGFSAKVAKPMSVTIGRDY